MGGRIHRLGVALGIALVVASCGAASPGEPTASPTNGPDPATYRYSCVGPVGFMPALFDRPGTGELEDHPSAQALRAFLAADRFGLGYLPDAGWWLESRDEREAQYIARLPEELESPFGNVTMQAHGDTWEFAGGGDCRPSIMLAGQTPTTWTLSPNHGLPGASTTEFTVLVAQTGCDSGEDVLRRLLPPAITYTDESIFIVFAARPFQGVTLCGGMSPTPAGV